MFSDLAVSTSFYLRLAWRNVLRHTGSTRSNIVAVALGCAALVIFSGFLHHLTEHRREQVIHTGLGHLQLARAGSWKRAAAAPDRYLIANYRELAGRLRSLPHVITVLPRLGFGGLMSNGDTTVTVLGQGVDAGGEAAFDTALDFRSGHNLAVGDSKGVIIGEGLAHALGVKVGDHVSLLTTSLEGSINGLDLQVRGIFVTGMEDYDNRGFRLPLQQAAGLLGTDEVQTLVVGLDDTRNLPSVQAALGPLTAGAALEIRTWDRLYPVLVSGLTWLQAAFAVVRLIILIIIGLSVANAVGQSVQERLGEIGTVLALGNLRRDVLLQFLAEGGILGLIGAVLGVVLSLALVLIVLRHGILMPPSPSNTQPERVYIDILPGAIGSAVLFLLGVTLVAAVVPAWRASRLPIVQALRANH